MKKKANTIARRSFLKLSLFGGLVATIGGSAIALSFRSGIRSVLESIHAELEIPEEVIDAFMSDATEMQLWERLKIRQKERLILMFYSVVPSAAFLPYSEYYENLKARIVGVFLPATTFFQNKMDTAEPLQYIGLYNPFKRSCGNPFSALYYRNTTT